jgi:hypothetical protein
VRLWYVATGRAHEPVYFACHADLLKSHTHACHLNSFYQPFHQEPTWRMLLSHQSLNLSTPPLIETPGPVHSSQTFLTTCAQFICARCASSLLVLASPPHEQTLAQSSKSKSIQSINQSNRPLQTQSPSILHYLHIYIKVYHDYALPHA